MRELLFSLTKKDFVVQTFQSGGPGGQHQNKTDSGVRIIHPESNARGESREHRSQFQNKKAALERLIESKKFKVWLSKKCFEIDKGKTIEKMVDEMMDPKNIKVECKEDGKWKETNVKIE